MFRKKFSRPEPGVVYLLQKYCGKSGWKVNGTWLFWSFQLKISGSNGTSENLVLFFRTEYSKQKFVFHYFKAIVDTSFRPSRSFFGKWNWFVQMVTEIARLHLPVLNFAYHLPKPWTDRFAPVNGKQPGSSLARPTMPKKCFQEFQFDLERRKTCSSTFWYCAPPYFVGKQLHLNKK